MERHQITCLGVFSLRNKIFVAKDMHVKDENGKLLDFNFMIDALNFISKIGYEFVTYPFNDSGAKHLPFLTSKKEGFISSWMITAIQLKKKETRTVKEVD